MEEIDSLTKAPEVSPRPRRHWGRLAIGLAVIAVVLSIGSWAARRALVTYQAQKELEAAMADLDRTEPGWRLDELENSRAPIDDQENGALAIMQIRELMPKTWAPSVPFARPECRLTPDQTENMRQELKAAAAALAKTQRLVDSPGGRFPAGSSADPLSPSPDCEQAYDVAVLFHLQAKVFDEDNDGNAALGAALGMLAAARAVGDEPRLLAQSVRLRCQGEALVSLVRTLAETQPGETMLVKVQKALEEEERQPLLLFVARGERAAHHQLALAAESDDAELSKVLVRVAREGPFFEEKVFQPSQGAVMRKCHARMLSNTTDFVQFAMLPAEEQGVSAQRLAAWRNAVIDGYELFLGLDYRLRSLPDTYRRQQALMRCAVVALAVERYRLVNQKWPETLEALIPNQLRSLVGDPFGGGSIKLKREKDGLTVYSIGQDPRENGAEPPAAAMVTLRLWNIAQRRQPPRPDDTGFRHPGGRRFDP